MQVKNIPKSVNCMAWNIWLTGVSF